MQTILKETPDGYIIHRATTVDPSAVEELREVVGWNRMKGRYQAILSRSYAQFTLHHEGRMVGFLNVIGDGIVDNACEEGRPPKSK
jgi:hypothetical protein